MSSVAIITARGGSKRIPGKNIKPFCGKPIIAYSIEAAIESKLFDEVMVSTDDNKIAEIAIQYGAKVPFMRSRENSEDHSKTVDVLVEVISRYRAEGKNFEYGCCLYPTAPFVNSGKLQESLKVLFKENADTLYSVVEFEFPLQRAFRIENGRIVYAQPEYANTRSQDLEPFYHDCGQFYWFKTESVMKEKSLMTSNTAYFEVPRYEAQDIDTLDDWIIAESLYRCSEAINIQKPEV
ncbi:MAG: pseudaminic acid cytidylyltransferase [Phycisphaerales bacterium]